MLKKVALIHTPCYEISDDRLEPPLGLLYLSTLLNQNGYEAVLLDLSSVPRENWMNDLITADVYGFDTYTSTYNRTLEILKLVKNLNPAAVTIAGGPHASALPRQVVRDFDYVVVGEGECRLLEMLGALNNGNPLDPIQYEILTHDLDALPFPDYSLVDVKSYHRTVDNQPSVGIISSRGCPYQCSFCTSSILRIDRKIRYRSPHNFVSEIKKLRELHDIHSFKIQDDIFTLSLNRVREIARLLTPLNIVYRCNSHIELCTNKEMLEILSVSGCRHITFGVESGAPAMLKRLNKRHTPEQVQTAISLAKEAGLIVRANLMVGFPGENWNTAQQTVDLMLACQPQEYIISAFVPYPGTAPYHYPEHYDIIDLEEDFSRYFLVRKKRETSYTFRTTELDAQVISEMRAYMIRELSPYIAWAGSLEGYR